jgi:hypothetical protein
MSDPRYTDPADPLHRSRNFPGPGSRLRPEFERGRGSGAIWSAVAAIIALAVVIALVAGYYRHEQPTASRPTPVTTGAGPVSPQAPLPSPANPAAPTTPAAPTPANPVTPPANPTAPRP